MEEYELGIIGGGPTGLFATFCAGIREINSITLEALDDFGGQATKLYPVKDVLDVEGIPRIKGVDLANSLVKQANTFGNRMVAKSKLTDIRKNPDGKFALEVNNVDSYVVRAVLICTGIGSLVPTKLNVDGEQEYENRGVYYTVNDLDTFSGKTVAVVGGGDAGFDWANQIVDVAKKILVLEYSTAIKAMERSVKELKDTGKSSVITNVSIKNISGDGKKVTKINFQDRTTGALTSSDVDSVIIAIGHKAEPNPLKSIKFDTLMNHIKVDEDFATNIPGIYAAGDVSISGNKSKVGLIVAGGAEAYGAINNIKKFLNPQASVFGEHSTNLKV